MNMFSKFQITGKYVVTKVRKFISAVLDALPLNWQLVHW